jgi:hypothetical protein
MNLKLSISIFFVLLSLGSCQQVQVNQNKIDCYFQVEYVNHAWGFNHSGFYITPAGEMYTYDKATPWIFAENNHIQRSDLLTNIGVSKKQDTLIGSIDLEHYHYLALMALDGKMSDIQMRGADMGLHLCKIIVPNSGVLPNDYREVILSQTGDTETHNLAPEAALITEWLVGIHLP